MGHIVTAYAIPIPENAWHDSNLAAYIEPHIDTPDREAEDLPTLLFFFVTTLPCMPRVTRTTDMLLYSEHAAVKKRGAEDLSVVGATEV